jgi:hypothetical protein
MGQKGFWDWENRHEKLSDKKNRYLTGLMNGFRGKDFARFSKRFIPSIASVMLDAKR